MEGGEDIIVVMVKMLEFFANVSTTQVMCHFVKVTYIKYTQIHMTLEIIYKISNYFEETPTMS